MLSFVEGVGSDKWATYELSPLLVGSPSSALMDLVFVW